MTNHNNDPLWQQASSFASEQVTATMRTKGLTGDEQHKKHTELRDAEYTRLMDVKRAEVKERVRKKSPEEIKAAQKAQKAADEVQRRIVITQQKAQQELETIRMNSAKLLFEIDQQLEETIPLVLAGLLPEAEETASVMERIKLEARQRAAITLNSREKQQAMDAIIAKAVADE